MTEPIVPQPYQPLIVRLLALVGQHGPLVTSHRQLAEQLGCSAGALPRLLRRLEEDGHIARERVGLATRITLQEPPRTPQGDHECDRAITDVIDHGCDRAITDVIDHGCDRPITDVITPDAPQQDAIEAPPAAAPAAAPEPPLAHVHARVPGRDQHDQHSTAQHARARSPRRPREVATATLWREILAANPGYTAEQFAADLATARARPDVPSDESAVRLVIHARRRGEPLYDRPLPPSPPSRRPEARYVPTPPPPSDAQLPVGWSY